MPEKQETISPTLIQKIGEFQPKSGQPLAVFLTANARHLDTDTITHFADEIDRVSGHSLISANTQMQLRNGNFEVCYVADADDQQDDKHKRMVGYATLTYLEDNGCYVERAETIANLRHQGIITGLFRALQTRFDYINTVATGGQTPHQVLDDSLRKLGFQSLSRVLFTWLKP